VIPAAVYPQEADANKLAANNYDRENATDAVGGNVSGLSSQEQKECLKTVLNSAIKDAQECGITVSPTEIEKCFTMHTKHRFK
jgi:hypothetical protein